MARHTFHCPMRWSDLDLYGHVNNVSYARYLEEARVHLLFLLGQPLGLFREAEGAVVAQIEIVFRAPMDYLPEGVDVDIWVGEITSGKFVLRYEIYSGTTVFATASSVMVPFDIEKGRSRRVSDDERKFLERLLEAADSSVGAG